MGRPSWLWATAVGVVVAACASDLGAAEPVFVENLSGGEVTIEYRVATDGREQLVVSKTLGVGAGQVDLPFDAGRCARGTLHALHDGREVGTVAQPCQGQRWRIDPLAAG